MTLLCSFILVKMEWTRNVLLNMEPKASVKPAMRTQALALQIYGKLYSLVRPESKPRMITLV